jgi:guanyl-specific ribonuclease Sa
MKTIPFARLLLCVAVVFCAGTGCHRNTPVPREKLVTRSELAVTIGEREVRASIAGTAIIKRQEEAAVISTETHRFTIERERVVVNSSEIARIPADAKRVVFTIADGGDLRIEADGVQLETKPFK